jgi:translation elongation factor EF-1alpha
METMKWARAKFDELRQFIEPMLWDLEFSIANTMFIPVSGLEGHNLVKPFSKIQQ